MSTTEKNWISKEVSTLDTAGLLLLLTTSTLCTVAVKLTEDFFFIDIVELNFLLYMQATAKFKISSSEILLFVHF